MVELICFLLDYWQFEDLKISEYFRSLYGVPMRCLLSGFKIYTCPTLAVNTFSCDVVCVSYVGLSRTAPGLRHTTIEELDVGYP